MSAKIIGIIGMFVTLIGGAANIISDAIDKKQTEAIGNIWKDEQFQRFNQDFNENIFKPVMKATTMMETEAHYIEKTVELQREIQKLKIR